MKPFTTQGQKGFDNEDVESRFLPGCPPCYSAKSINIEHRNITSEDSTPSGSNSNVRKKETRQTTDGNVGQYSTAKGNTVKVPSGNQDNDGRDTTVGIAGAADPRYRGHGHRTEPTLQRTYLGRARPHDCAYPRTVPIVKVVFA